MANDPPRYLPAGVPLSPYMPARNSGALELGVQRVRSTDNGDGLKRRPRHESHTINNQGITGNARVMNIVGDQITHNDYGLGEEAHTVLESIECRLKVVHDTVLDGKIDDWLSAPDVSQNLNAAQRRRQAGTGDWFLDGEQFAEWKENANIVLCIFGAPGCGKTVLCSSVIEAVKDLCKTRLSSWAYFFFDGRNANKGLQLYENFLRAILSQLCSRCGGIPEVVKVMYQAHGSGREQPSVKALEEALRQVMGAFDDVYIMVDSLDESSDRLELLKWIETMAGWNSAMWHLLVTSRSEHDITGHLERIPNMQKMYLQGTALEKDIIIYLDERLSCISGWSEPIRVLVKTTLIRDADAMFRWVAMQIDSLQYCLKAREVEKKLKALPKDLEETYEHILASSTHRDELLQMLHWLAFSARALRVEELAEVLSVDFAAQEGPCYDPGMKYANPQSALTVCSGLVTVTDGFVKLAHFSVKEYLISDRIKTGTAAQFSTNEQFSQLIIAQTCIAYLLIFNQPHSIQTPVETTGPFPLHLYAAEYTDRHLVHVTENSPCPALQKLLLDLFLPVTPHFDSALVNWVHIYNPDLPSLGVDPSLRRPAGKVAPPIYYASLLGLQYVVERLLQRGTDVNTLGGFFGTALHAAASSGHTGILKMLLEHHTDANLQGGQYGTLLNTAVFQGHTDIVKILLDCDADVNLVAGFYGTALQAAASRGHIGIFQLLLEHGADANIQGGQYSSALHAAVVKGHTPIVEILLSGDADVNLTAGLFGTALHAAASSGHTGILKILLEHHADPNIQGGQYGTALHAAVVKGYSYIIEILLDGDTDVNLQGGQYGTALQAAVSLGRAELVKMLLDAGADENIQGGQYGTALQAAVVQGHTEVVKILLEGGADANIQGGQYGTALQAAVSHSRTCILKMLLEHRADANIQGVQYGIPLHAAVEKGHTSTIEILLDGGADVNIQGGLYRTALQAAASRGHISIVQIFLKHYADVNIQGGQYGSALHAAVVKDHVDIVPILLDGGANVDLVAGFYGTALQAAASRGYVGILKMLLEHHADANIQGGQYGSALHAAVVKGHIPVIKILLDGDPDVNLLAGFYGTVLQAAAFRGHIGIFKMLLDHGVDANIQGGQYCTALHAAVFQGHTEMIHLLIDSGANVNIQGGQYATALQAAAANGHTNICKLLLERGADTNVQGGMYGTALYATAYEGHTEAAKLLLDNGADMNMPSWIPARGGPLVTTALQVAAARGHTETHQLLLQRLGAIAITFDHQLQVLSPPMAIENSEMVLEESEMVIEDDGLENGEVTIEDSGLEDGEVAIEDNEMVIDDEDGEVMIEDGEVVDQTDSRRPI